MLAFLRAMLRKDLNFHLGDDEPIVGPAVGATHGLCHAYILPVPVPDNDEVKEIPELGAGVHP